MSAPLVVNTTDGTVWTRRAITRGGLALYAPEGVCNCPTFVMATMAELAEHGIAGAACVLPMPVGPAPQDVPAPAADLTAEAHAAIAEQLGDAQPARNGVLVTLAKSTAQVREHDHPKWEDIFCHNLLWYMGERMAPVLRRLIDAEAEAERLRAKLAEYERPADEDPITYALTPKATDVRDVTPQVQKLRDLLAGQRRQTGGAPC